MRDLNDELLRVARTSGFEIGDAQAPADQNLPYAVVYSLTVAERDGPMSDTTADGWYEYQVTCVGMTRVQTQALSDLLEPILLAGTYTVSGYVVKPIIRGDTLSIERDDTLQPPVFYQTTMFSLFVTPAS